MGRFSRLGVYSFVAGFVLFVSGADLHWRVHPFAPQRPDYTGESLRRSDARVVSIATGQRFVVERTVRTVDGVPAYMTFVYLPP